VSESEVGTEGTEAPTASPATATPPAAGTLLAGAAPNPAELAPTEETAAERMFGSRESLRTDYGPAFKNSLDQLSDATGITPEQREAMLDEAAEIFSDARINSTEASGLYGLLATHMTAPADDTMEQEWATETRRELRQRYGDDAGRRLEAAQKFVAARPDLKRTLDETGLGSHPRIVLALTEKADQLRVAPRKRK